MSNIKRSEAPRVTDAAWDTLPSAVRAALDPDSSSGFYNEAGDFELEVDGRLAVVVLTDEGVIVDYFIDGEAVDGWWATWSELTEDNAIERDYPLP